jgi:exopolyphosphatase/guanosine-5'-triphosphate,3'-diphosphate pyrophosphatase
MSDKRRLAALDVGTNSVRMLVVEATNSGEMRVLEDEKATTRLGQGLDKTGQLSAAGIERTVEVLKGMGLIAHGYGVHELAAVATSAVRTASNGAEFLTRAQQEAGISLRVIEGEEEGRLAFRSAAHHFAGSADEPVVVVDIGGGSTEIISGRGKVVDQVISVEIGAVRMTERFLTHDPPHNKEFDRLRRRVRKVLRKRLPGKAPGVARAIASGGTASALARVAMDMREQSFERVHGFELKRSQVHRALKWLRKTDADKRAALTGISKTRADILVAGVAILNEVLKRLRLNTVKINEEGIREGLLLELMERNFATPPRRISHTHLATEGVLRLARACDFDQPHCFRVARTALRLFDDLQQLHELEAKDRLLLWASSYLHDVGCHVDYTRHHRHSYRLIRHARLPGLTPQEVEIIAAVARYHRRRLPKKKDPELQYMGKAGRRRVKRLAALLRLADGLDASHRGRVRSVRAEIKRREILVHVGVTEDATLEIWEADRKADLAAKVFQRRLRFVAVADTASASPDLGTAVGVTDDDAASQADEQAVVDHAGDLVDARL